MSSPLSRHMNSQLTLLPVGVTVPAQRGDTLMDVALAHGIPLPHECGGNCSCTTCHVVVLSGAENLSPMEEPEDERLGTAAHRFPQSRLACQALLVGGEVTVWVVENVELGSRGEELAVSPFAK